MFLLQPTPRRTATNPDQRTLVVECCDQREARRGRLRKIKLLELNLQLFGDFLTTI